MYSTDPSAPACGVSPSADTGRSRTMTGRCEAILLNSL
jgi:hypothetical protein